MTESTRERLLHASTRLMLEQGYHRTTVDQICVAAGMTKGAFFHHFDSKGAVALATLDRYADRIFDVLDRGARSVLDDPVRRLFTYLDGLARIGELADRRAGCLIAIQTMELSLAHPKFRARCRFHFDRWARSLEALLEDAGVIKAGQRAAQFIALFEGSLLLARASGDMTPIAQNVNRFAAHLRDQLPSTIH